MTILLDIIEVLLFLVCVLFSVAYLTVAERKTLGYFQRRLGPNAVGQLKQLKTYHITRSNPPKGGLDQEAINDLYKDRSVPVKIFNGPIIDTCYNILDLNGRSEFMKKWHNISGIYIIKYNDDIYYIGQTVNFSSRFKSHIKQTLVYKDRFHLFGNIVGWDKFEFSIIEECPLDIIHDREDFYLKEYLPLLNTKFMSRYRKERIYHSLYDKLNIKQANHRLKDKFKNIQPGVSQKIYVYYYFNNIDKNCKKYESIKSVCKNLNISSHTLRAYKNTHVPFKNRLFYTYPISSNNFPGTGRPQEPMVPLDGPTRVLNIIN